MALNERVHVPLGDRYDFSNQGDCAPVGKQGYINYAKRGWGSVELPRNASSQVRRWKLRQVVQRELPAAWVPQVLRLATAARAGALPFDRDRLEANVLDYWLTKYGGADAADLSEVSIRERADEVARRGAEAGFAGAVHGDGGAWGAWGRLCEFVGRNGGAVTCTRRVYTLKAWAARVACPKWWRRTLRKWISQQYERGAIELGRVGAAAREWYCSNRAVKRRIQQNAANEAAMRATKIESATGQSMTVWDAAQLTVSNKAIRRGELMTRIRGCEVWADAQGLAGIFTTNTCPSRFHSQRKGGGANPNYDGSTPADAQRWLSVNWARLRAKLARESLPAMGFRVAEPHHDGCVHWHMLLWCAPRHVEAVSALMRAQWLKDAGDEPGAKDYRVNIKPMIAGMASGYIAKYISKNIDDAHVSSHTDDEAPALSVGPDLLGDLEVKPCHRVEAWAALWRIRQFQAIGQPSVTVWRELRRVTQDAAAAASDAFVRAWLAVHRKGDKRADWDAYIRAQGGAMQARADYRLCLHTVDRDKVGRYEEVRERWVCGVLDRGRALLPVTCTRRERWGGSGFAAQAAAPPWTRLNNCTAHNAASVGKVANEVHELVSAGLLDVVGVPVEDEMDRYRRFFAAKMAESEESSCI